MPPPLISTGSASVVSPRKIGAISGDATTANGTTTNGTNSSPSPTISIKKPNLSSNSSSANNTEILAITMTCLVVFLFFFLLGFVTWWRAAKKRQAALSIPIDERESSKPAESTATHRNQSKTNMTIISSPLKAFSDNFASISFPSFTTKQQGNDSPPRYDDSIRSKPQQAHQAVQEQQKQAQQVAKKVSRKEIEEYFSKPIDLENENEKHRSRLSPPSPTNQQESNLVYPSSRNEDKQLYPSRSRKNLTIKTDTKTTTIDRRKGKKSTDPGVASTSDRVSYFTDEKFKSTINRRPLKSSEEPYSPTTTQTRNRTAATRERGSPSSSSKSLGRKPRRQKSLGRLPQRQDSIKRIEGRQNLELPPNSTMPMANGDNGDIYPKLRTSQSASIIEFYDNNNDEDLSQYFRLDASRSAGATNLSLSRTEMVNTIKDASLRRAAAKKAILDPDTFSPLESPEDSFRYPVSSGISSSTSQQQQAVPSLSRLGMLDSIKSASLRRAQQKNQSN